MIVASISSNLSDKNELMGFIASANTNENERRSVYFHHWVQQNMVYIWIPPYFDENSASISLHKKLVLIEFWPFLPFLPSFSLQKYSAQKPRIEQGIRVQKIKSTNDNSISRLMIKSLFKTKNWKFQKFEFPHHLKLSNANTKRSKIYPLKSQGQSDKPCSHKFKYWIPN